MQPIEPITVETTTVGCDGGDGPSGHPKVYLAVAPDRPGECPYCGRRYVLGAGARITHGH